MKVMRLTITDGSPPLMPELPRGSTGPPFGAAPGSVLLSCVRQLTNHSVGSLTAANALRCQKPIAQRLLPEVVC